MSEPAQEFDWEKAFGEPTQEVVVLPAEIDDEWCADFQEHHGKGIKHSQIDSDFCFLQDNPFESSTKMYFVDVAAKTGQQSTTIEGRVLKVVVLQDYEDTQQSEPYLVMDEVSNAGIPLTRHREQIVWVPLQDSSELLLFD